MSNYNKELLRRLIHENLLQAKAHGDDAEVRRLAKRLWANAHGVADDDRRAGR